MTPTSSLLDELAEALADGSNTRRVEMLSRITDLFVGDAERYSPVQVDVFDEVIAKLANAIEAKARAKLAVRLAEITQAPAGVVRMLAFDDDIEVARPVLAIPLGSTRRICSPPPTARARPTSPPFRNGSR
jgi:uncharacterized protein (DUF2336 family)